MPGLRNQVLIFEDDPTQAQALSAAFGKENFIVHTTSNEREANEILDSKPIGTLILDCLLPGISGVEFAESIRSKYPPATLDIILMSGILMDPVFIKESLQATKAKHFLKKPFSLREILGLVEKVESPDSISKIININPRMALYQLFNQSKLTARNKRKALDALDEIDGYDLPFVYSLMVQTRSSGNLNLVTAQGEVFGVCFAEGNIISVDIPDKETFLGKLLVDKGYLHPGDLAIVVADKSHRKFGEKLITSFMISPHALDWALVLQMSVRLSKTIVDQKVAVNFAEAKNELLHPHIDPSTFSTFVHDWIASKISLSWLRTHYVQWLSCAVVKTSYFSPEHPALQVPLVLALPDLIPTLSSGLVLAQIIDSKKFSEEPLYKALHYLLTEGLFVFSNKPAQVSNSDRVKQLRRLSEQMDGLNKIEIFDLMTQVLSATGNSAETILADFKNILGGQPQPEDKELYSLHQQLSNLATKAYEFVKSGSRDKMRDQIAISEVEARLKAAQQFEEAKNFLQQNSYQLALKTLLAVQQSHPRLEKLRIYLVWAKLGSMTGNNRQPMIHEAQMDLLQIPTEERFDPLYSFAQGLLEKAKGNLPVAQRFFQKALSLDSSLIAVRRELNLLANAKTAQKQKKDVLNRDLKDMISSFFRTK